MGLYKSQDFALDPTDPRFTKSGSNAADLAKEVAKRRSKVKDTEGTKSRKQQEKEEASGGGGGGGNADKADLKLLVASLKRKAGNAGGGGKKSKAI